MRKLFMTISAVLFMYGFAESQKDTTDVFDMTLEELMNVEVTTASKLAQKATDAPATVYVVTAEQIQARNYSCLKELLEDIPQVEIQKKSRSQTSDVFTVNGVSGNEKLIILQDGIRITSTTGTEHFISESYLLGNAKQVEVILGPASALYGADAFTGVVNIITKDGSGSPNFSVRSSYGNFNTSDTEAFIGLGNDDISFTASGKYYHSDEPFFPDYYPEEYSWYDHYQETGEMMMFGDTVDAPFGILPWAFDTDAYSAHAKLKVKSFEIGYSRMFERQGSSVGSPPSIYVYTDETVYANHVQNAYARHIYNSDNGNFTLNSTVSGQDFKVYPYSLFYNQYAAYLDAYKYERNRTIKVEEQFNYAFSDKLIAVGGLSYEYISAIPKTSDLPVQYDESKPPEEQDIYYPGTNVTDANGNDLTIMQDIYHIKYSNIGSYLQVQYSPVENLRFTVGTRYDYNSRYKSTINPRAGMVFNPSKKFTLKLLYGHAYLAPSPYKAYQHYGSFYPTTNDAGEVTGLASGFWHLPNPDLEPEKRKSFDAYFLYYITESLAASVNGYYGMISNLVGTAGYDDLTFKDVPVGFVSKTINEGDAVAYGGTFRLDFKRKLGSKISTNIFAAYSYSDGEIDEAPLIFSSEHTVLSGIGFRFTEKFNIYAKILYRSGSHARFSTFDEPVISDPFTLVNLNMNYRFLDKARYSASIFVRATNITDARYYNAGYEAFGMTPQDPLRFNFGIKFAL